MTKVERDLQALIIRTSKRVEDLHELIPIDVIEYAMHWNYYKRLENRVKQDINVFEQSHKVWIWFHRGVWQMFKNELVNRFRAECTREIYRNMEAQSELEKEKLETELNTLKQQPFHEGSVDMEDAQVDQSTLKLKTNIEENKKK